MASPSTWVNRQANGLPLLVDMRHDDVPIVNQLSANSCSANSAVDVMEIWEVWHGTPCTLSRLFQYYNERTYTPGALNSDNGAESGSVFKSAAELGVCLESTWPYNLATVQTKPSQAAYMEAQSHKITSYSMLPQAQLKVALAMGYPVRVAMNVRTGFFDVYGSKSQQTAQFATYLQTPVVGGHDMVILGYDARDNTILIRNSWGTGWGDGGYCYMPESILLQDEFNLWVVTGYNGYTMPAFWTPDSTPVSQPTVGVYLGPGEQFISACPAMIYGNTPRGMVTLLKAARNNVLDSNIGTLALPDRTLEDLGLLQQGSSLEVRLNGELLASLNTSNGASHQLILADGNHVLLRINAIMTLDGTVIS
jgi:hypothetical protein